jgi:hypothetical protein
MAAALGFRDLHVFGIDGSARESRHADEHPNEKHELGQVEYDGQTYVATEGMLEAARQIWHELDELPAVHATFHGAGLVQAMAKNYVQKQPDPRKGTGAILVEKTISEDYRKLNEQMHRERPDYGVWGGRHARAVAQIAEGLKTTSILDYGCGKGTLGRSLSIPIWEYDPAIPGKSDPPRPADLVVCTDVLEHIEPELLGATLYDLKRCTRKTGYFVINTAAAKKSYPDGRNTHLIQEKMDWWVARIKEFFSVVDAKEYGAELYILVAPIGASVEVAQDAEELKVGA